MLQMASGIRCAHVREKEREIGCAYIFGRGRKTKDDYVCACSRSLLFSPSITHIPSLSLSLFHWHSSSVHRSVTLSCSPIFPFSITCKHPVAIQTYVYDSFHWKCYILEIRQIERFKSHGISRYKFIYKIIYIYIYVSHIKMYTHTCIRLQMWYIYV